MKHVYTLISILLFGFIMLPAQWAVGDSVHAKFSNNGDAGVFLEKAQNNGQGKGAMVTHHPDGTTSVTLPNVATENMSETAMEAISDNANAVDIGPQIPDAVIIAMEAWFDALQGLGDTGIRLSSFTDGFEYVGCLGISSIGFDRSYSLGNTFFAYSDHSSTMVEISALDPNLENPIKAAIETEAVDRGITYGAYGDPCP